MTVINTVTVTFFIVAGITFITCAIPANKRDPELKKEIRKRIGHKLLDDNAPDVLFRALSNFGVARRPLNPDQSKLPVEIKKRNIIEKLKLSVTFRDNMLYIFSYLLHGREGGITEEQYTSLQMLYDVLRKRMVYTYNILPVLLKMEDGDKNQLTKTILLSLMRNLPPYLQCTAKFLVNEIHLKNIDLNALLRPTKYETFNYLVDINPDVFFKNNVKFADEEMRGYDKYSNITQKVLGPIFVKLLHNLHTNKLPLSQELFGLILMNLPNPSDDPVLEENIRYLYDVTSNNLITNWDSIGNDPVGKDAYTLVFSTLSRILTNPNTGIVVKNAAVYVYNHLKPVIPIYANPNFRYMYNLIKRDIDMGLLLAAIMPREFDVDAIRMKNRLLTYFMQNYRNKDLKQALKGFNRFGYHDPLDLLMAFLTRISNRIPVLEVDILQPTATLLSALIVKKHVRAFTPFVSPEVDILILLESIKSPNLDPILSTMIDSIKLDLIAQPRISVLLNTLIPLDKNKCLTPRQCLMNTLQRAQRMQGNIPIALITKIQEVIYMLKSMPMRYQQQSFPSQYSVITGDIDLYNVEHENPVIIVADSAHNIPVGLGGNPYVWNTDKYISKIGPTMQDGSSRTPAVIDSMETNEVPLTTAIDQAQISDYVPPRINENSQDQSFPLKPSVTTTSMSHDVTQKIPDVSNESILTSSSYDVERQSLQPKPSHKSSQKPEIKISESTRKYQTTHRRPLTQITKEDVSEEHDSDNEYLHITKSVYRETKSPNQPSISDESMEDQKNLPKKIHRVPEELPSTSQKSSQQKAPKMTKQKKQERPRKERPLENETPVTSESFENPPVTTEYIAQFNDQEIRPHIKPKLSKAIKEETLTDAKDVSTMIMLPPSIEPDQPLTIQLSKSGVPVITTDDRYNTTVPGLVLPKIKELLKPPNMNDFLGEIDTPIVKQVLQPLSVIFGKNYIRKILKGTDPKLYSTNIALLTAILKKAKTHPQVTKNSELINLIRKYIASIEYVSPTILLPVVISFKKLSSTVVYSTFNPHDLTHSEISENPPDESSPDSVTIPLVNPKTWLQSINPSNPYADLLPALPKGITFEITLRPLKKILTPEKISEILGPDFEPLAYPNKGALLITLLHKLRKVKAIQSNVALKTLIEMYIHAIELPSMNIHVSEDKFVKMISESRGHWQAELTSLIYALPTAKRDAEVTMLERIERFLADPSLLEKLNISKPSSTMSRGELLRKIMVNTLSGKMRLEKHILEALRYYKDKVKFSGMGALPIMWVWVEVYVLKAEVKLGDMIQQTIDFNKLEYKEKLAYNDLVMYLAKNPDILQNNEDFAFEKYKTQGKFVQGLFKYLLKKPQINGRIKKDIQLLFSRVMLTGPGAILMPSFSESF